MKLRFVLQSELLGENMVEDLAQSEAIEDINKALMYADFCRTHNVNTGWNYVHANRENVEKFNNLNPCMKVEILTKKLRVIRGYAGTFDTEGFRAFRLLMIED